MAGQGSGLSGAQRNVLGGTRVAVLGPELQTPLRVSSCRTGADHATVHRDRCITLRAAAVGSDGPESLRPTVATDLPDRCLRLLRHGSETVRWGRSRTPWRPTEGSLKPKLRTVPFRKAGAWSRNALLPSRTPLEPQAARLNRSAPPVRETDLFLGYDLRRLRHPWSGPGSGNARAGNPVRGGKRQTLWRAATRTLERPSFVFRRVTEPEPISGEGVTLRRFSRQVRS